MAVTWDDTKHYLKEKCAITIAFIGEVIFELIRVTFLLIGVWAFLTIANFLGLGNNEYIKLLHEFSLIGFSIIYAIVLIYGIIDFHRIFNKPYNDGRQLTLKEATEEDEENEQKNE